MKQMPRNKTNFVQDLTLGTPRLIAPPSSVPNDRKPRSTHDAFAYKFQTISRKLLIYVVNEQIYTWLGEPMSWKNCLKLIDLYLCGKIKNKKFLKYLFHPNA